jgi:sigma-E factor negative regulatory protein RseB
MEARVLRWLPLFALMSCLLPVTAAGAPDAAALADARNWLVRINTAARTGNYEGTLVLRVGDLMSSSRVVHFASGADTFELLEALDGDQQRVLRHNDLVHTLRPKTRQALVERRETLGASVTTPQTVDPLALEQYDFKREGSERLAGRDAVVILLEPRDLLRYAQRLWADQSSGLMLRADVMGPVPAGGGARPTLETTQFSEVKVGLRPQPDVVMQDLRNPRLLDGYKVVRPQLQRTTLAAEGFELKRSVPGFILAGCVRRGLESAGESAVLQAVFTDGLTHVSLFVEPYKALRHSAELRAQMGAAGTLTQRRGNLWFTVVGDVPLATLKLFADAVERKAP